jgi:hypothetical protein
MMATMKVRHSVRYAAPIGDVYAMLTDPAFREKAAHAQDATDVKVSVDGQQLTLDMQASNSGLPGFAQKFAGDRTHSITSEQWSDGSVAEFSVATPGKPTSITGTRRLVADGDATLDTFEGECKAKVPLIGGKLEGIMAGQFTDGLDKEHAVGVAWLKGER